MQTLKGLKKYWRIPVSLVLAGILFSCVNDLDTIKKVTYNPNSASEVTENMKVFYTDSGYPKVKIFARIAETYTQPKEITKFKDGISVDFFDDFGERVSTLTALYGEIQKEEGMMLVRDSVVLFNYEKQQKLETEELIWNQKDSLIYSEKHVKVTSPKGIVHGQGIRTRQDFTNYTFQKPIGSFNLKN